MKLIDHIAHEHHDILPHIDQLKQTADMVGVAPAEDIRQATQSSYEFLTHQLIPHAKAEDAVLYPLIARYMGYRDVTNVMSRDHEEVGTLTARLGKLLQTDMDATELRRVLYSLHAIVRLHFEKEESYYLPVLREHLTVEDDEKAAHAMHHLHEH